MSSWNPREINVSLFYDFYARWNSNDEEHLVPIRGRLTDISSSALSAYLEVLDVLHEPLGIFIARLTYQDLRHTLCGVDSMAVRVRDKKT